MLVAAAVAVWGAHPAHASSLVALQTTSAVNLRGAFLAQGMGARPVSMGEAFTAVADDASGLAWNPGGLGQLQGLGAVVMHDLVGENMGLSFASLASPVGGGVAGVSIAALSFGAYDLRNSQGIKTGVGSLTDIAASAGWAMANPAWLGGRGWTGVAAEYVGESPGTPMFGLGFGSLIPVGGNVTIGWAVQHLGAVPSGFGLPQVAKAGATYAAPGMYRIAFDAAYPLVDRQPWLAVGVEVTPHPVFAIRAGYKWRAQDRVLGGLTGLTAGIGVHLGRFGLDYAYQPFGDLVVSHRVALVYGGGPVPARQESPAAAGGEKVPASTTAHGTAGPSAPGLYAEALKLAAAKDHATALARLRVLLKAEPRHWQGWQLAGNCLLATGKTETALKAYRYSLKLHPNNPELKAWLETQPDR